MAIFLFVLFEVGVALCAIGIIGQAKNKLLGFLFALAMMISSGGAVAVAVRLILTAKGTM